jgi:transcriptional regulator with PAS, ATPase and Fis domain
VRRHGGNRTRAAEELGISRATLINKIKVYALDV